MNAGRGEPKANARSSEAGRVVRPHRATEAMLVEDLVAETEGPEVVPHRATQVMDPVELAVEPQRKTAFLAPEELQKELVAAGPRRGRQARLMARPRRLPRLGSGLLVVALGLVLGGVGGFILRERSAELVVGGTVTKQPWRLELLRAGIVRGAKRQLLELGLALSHQRRALSAARLQVRLRRGNELFAPLFWTAQERAGQPLRATLFLPWEEQRTLQGSGWFLHLVESDDPPLELQLKLDRVR